MSEHIYFLAYPSTERERENIKGVGVKCPTFFLIKVSKDTRCWKVTLSCMSLIEEEQHWW